MYSTLLTMHSLLRWAVLFVLLLAIIRAYRGWFGKSPFTSTDNSLRTWAVIIVHIQFLLSVALYFVSPLVQSLFSNFKEGVKESSVRYFSMEHSLMMLVAIVLITIGAAKTRRKTEDEAKFKTMAIWFTIGLLIILVAIPWPFSPMAARPYFRGF